MDVMSRWIIIQDLKCLIGLNAEHVRYEAAASLIEHDTCGWDGEGKIVQRPTALDIDKNVC